MTEPGRNEFTHEPVLREEIVAWLTPPERGVFVDFTVGGGGHLAALLAHAPGNCRFFGVDRDSDAVAVATIRFRDESRVEKIIHASFATALAALEDLNITTIHGALFDLGVSSHQIDTGARGFSFQVDGPLDMRMDRRETLTAEKLLQSSSLAELTNIIREYGEERRARQIASAIVANREKSALTTSDQLRDLIEKTIGRANLTKTLARVYQALRIAVNGELDQLRTTLPLVVEKLAPAGRIGVISYHSLEDRIVKEFIRSRTGKCVCPPGLPVCVCGARPELRELTRKPITAGEDEIARNPRARSAKFRVAEKIDVSNMESAAA